MFYSLVVLPANKQMPGDMFPRRFCFILVSLLDEKKRDNSFLCKESIIMAIEILFL